MTIVIEAVVILSHKILVVVTEETHQTTGKVMAAIGLLGQVAATGAKVATVEDGTNKFLVVVVTAMVVKTGLVKVARNGQDMEVMVKTGIIMDSMANPIGTR